MTKQNLLDTISTQIVQNEDGRITAKIVKDILDSLVALLPSNDAEGSPATKEIIAGFLSSGQNITITEESGKLVIALDGELLDDDSVKTIINEHIEAGTDITAEVIGGKLQISFSGTIPSKEEILKDIEATSPVNATYDDTSNKLSLSLVGYDSNSAFSNSATIEEVQSHGQYIPVAYNLALYDSYNIDNNKFMLPPSDSASQGILINLYEVDSGFLNYVSQGLIAGIYQRNNDGTLHTIIEGEIESVNNPNQRKLFLALTNTSRNEPIRDINIAQPLYVLKVENKIQKKLANKGEITKDEVEKLARYSTNPDLIQANMLPYRLLNNYTLIDYNKANYDASTIEQGNLMLPPEDDDAQGFLVGLYDNDIELFEYLFGTNLLHFRIFQFDESTNTNKSQIVSGYINSYTQTNNNLFVSISFVNHFLEDPNINLRYIAGNTGDICKLFFQNKAFQASRDVQDQMLRNFDNVWTEFSTTNMEVSKALGRTRRLIHITPWEYDGNARTIYIEWKPVYSVASGTSLTIRIEGITKTYTLTEALAHNDSHGLLVPFNATSQDAANILRNAVNSRSGFLLCSVEDPYNTTTDYCWIPVVDSMNWTPLTGNSPYTISSHYKEFLVEFGTSASKVYALNVARIQIPTTTKTFLVDTERPDGSHVAELGLNMSLNGNTLTAEIRQQDTSGGSISIQTIYAR